jgi:hypothetical protein
MVEVDLDIDYLAADDPTEWTPGGFVCVEGRRKITLQKVQPADWGTTSGDSTKRVRLSWGSTNIAIYTAATGGIAVISGTDYANANLPTNFWVEGVAVSATAGTSTAQGPETILAQAIPDGMYDRISFTVYQVDSITVTPKNAPAGWTPPVPVTIGAGAIHSPAHQADVTIQVQPTVAGIPIDVSLSGGLSYQPGKAAELTLGTQAATGGGAVVTVLTGTNGTITGELTSSDVNNMECTIHASATEANVRFTWDEYFEQDAWTFEPGYLPVPGVLTNHLVLRHHRDGNFPTTTNGMPWQPFNGHDIRFFVEKVEYWDADGNLCETNNTAEAPADVSAWATFPTNPVTTDANGRVTELLTIVTNANLQSVSLVAYDWSVWVSSAPAAPVAPLSGFGFRALAAPPAPPAPPAPSSGRTNHVLQPMGAGELRYFLAFQPRTVPLHVAVQTPTNYGGNLVIYLHDLQAHSTNWTFEIRSNKVSSTGQPGWTAPVPSTVAEIKQIYTDVPGGTDYIASGFSPDRFNHYSIVVREPARYQVYIKYQSTYLMGPFEFDTPAVGVDFAGLNATEPIILTTNKYNYAIFPLYNESAILVVTGKVVATSSTGSPYSLDSINTLNAGSKFRVTNNIVGQPLSFQMSGLSEGDHVLNGTFKMTAKGIRKRINSINGLVMLTYTDTNAAEVRFGSFTNLHLVCPIMHIASPSGSLPPDGQAGANYSPALHSLYVFDTPTAPSNCLMACETPHLTGLSNDFVRSLVWKNVEWINPSVSTVGSVTTNTFPAEPWKTEFRYNEMPLINQAFGNTNLVLRFKNRHAWRWDQPIQFRFARTGTNAAARVNSVLGFVSAWSTNYVKAGNPNWYVYWQQVANGFSKNDGPWPSGRFGPQAQRMVYSNSLIGTSASFTNYAAWYAGGPIYDYGSTSYLWSDEIAIFDTNKCGIYPFIRAIHHENGHRQSSQLPFSQGGWGPELAYDKAYDIGKEDYIHDTWQKSGGAGYDLGIRIAPFNAWVAYTNAIWRSNWTHGWITTNEVKNPPLSPPAPYTNTNGVNSTTGSGLCPRNEMHVEARKTDIELKDWSWVVP